MGWFDESDDEESENEVADQTKTNVIADEDPLDAYMASITSKEGNAITEGESSQRNKRQKSKAERLDYENDDEATSHWVSTSSKSTKDLDNYSDVEEVHSNGTSSHAQSSDSTKKAAAGLSSIFHRAGSKPVSTDKKRNESQKKNRENEYSSDDSDIESNLKLAVKHKNGDNTIESLPPVDHSQIKYHPFRRSFFNASTTETMTESKSHSWRSQHSISVSLINNGNSNQPLPLAPILTPFSSPPLSTIIPPSILQHLTTNHLIKPTLVQAQTFPIALSGHDTIVTASTGSGKTMAYLIPMVVHCLDQPYIEPNKDGPIGIILVPTRELATQIYAHASKMMKKVGGNVISVIGGGKGRYELSKDLRKGCEIVVSTPGRLIDMLKGRDDKAPTNLRRVTMVVLDEADRMLEMGFESQVGSILKNVRPDRHMMMFSATFGRRVEKVAESWLKDPVRVAIGKTGASSSHISQHVIVLPSPSAKLSWLISMLPILVPLGKLIIFVASRVECENILHVIRNNFQNSSENINAESIHGDKHQHDRNAALRQFEKGKVHALVATDVASRGLDVKNVMTVINFDVAKNLDIHTHRIGRAGRMLATQSSDNSEEKYQKGVAYTLMTRKNADFANLLMENFIKENKFVENELKDLAKHSKYFGRHEYGGIGGKRQNHGIGWNRDEFSTSVSINDFGDFKNKEKGSRSTSLKKSDDYYGPSSTMQLESNCFEKANIKQSNSKRKRWG